MALRKRLVTVFVLFLMAIVALPDTGEARCGIFGRWRGRRCCPSPAAKMGTYASGRTYESAAQAYAAPVGVTSGAGVCPVYGDYEWDGLWLYYGYECTDATSCPNGCDLAKWGGLMWFTERLPLPYCGGGGNCDPIISDVERSKQPGENHEGHKVGLSKEASLEPQPFRGKGERLLVKDPAGNSYKIIVYNVIDKTQKKNIRVKLGIEAAANDTGNFAETNLKLQRIPKYDKFYRTLDDGTDVYQVILRGTWQQ